MSREAEVLKILLDAGVAVDQRYDNDLTALMWAAGYGHDETVRFLLSRGADTSARDNRGKTAADIAREAGHAATLTVLNPS